ncbi:alpha/beta fold hydrolase [Maricaulis sp.]|uniref:alpha/beta hydrolase family protein n=1 Tax=Maricaulis sp. TaxID=1486257 RepID=UPI00262C8232|nr:alpha/beta fold hydrolase [Maricaulis sp.]
MPGAVTAQVDVYAPLPRVWDAELSPDGRWLATGCTPRGAREICVIDLNGEVATRLIVQPDEGSILGFYWPSNDYLVYWVETFVDNTYGSQGQQYTLTRAVSWSAATGQVSLLLSDIGNVTGLDRVTSSMVQSPDRIAMELTLDFGDQERTGSRLARGESVRSVVYEVDLETGELDDILHRSMTSTYGYHLDESGEILLQVIYEQDSGVYTLQSGPDGSRGEVFSGQYFSELPYIHGRVGDSDLIAIRFPDHGLQLLDPSTGERTAFEIDGQAVTGGLRRDRRSNRIVSAGLRTAPDGIHFFDETLQARYNALREILAEDAMSIISWSEDYNRIVVRATDQGQPSYYYLLDWSEGTLSMLEEEYLLPEGTRAGERDYYTYAASDGLEIGAWLTMPPGRTLEDGPFPLLVMPHGGPRAHDTGAFDWWAAYYASQGYLVMQPNFRGSTGYGREFIDAGDGGFGTRMIDDMIDGARAVQAEGYARDGAYCAVGASYGGYASLMMALRDPDNVACLVAVSPVTAPFAFMGEDIENRLFVRWWEEYMGSRFSDRDYRDEITPARRAGELRLPMMVLHGDEDTTVPIDQMERLERAMDGRRNATFVVLEGEDHYLGNTAVRQALLSQSGAFLAEHLPVQ